MIQGYVEVISFLERLHRQFLDLVKLELERLGLDDVGSVQALLLFNVGTETVSVGDLTLRGYYLGSNVTYNLKKLVEAGYVVHERSQNDRRIVRVRLSQKGLELHEQLRAIFERHAEDLVAAGLSAAELESLPHLLHRVERFWIRQADLLSRRRGRPL